VNYIQYFTSEESTIMHANSSDPTPEERQLKSCHVLTHKNHWFKGRYVAKWPITKGQQCVVIQYQELYLEFQSNI